MNRRRVTIGAVATLVLLASALLSACDMTPEQVVATVEGLSASELAGLSATIEALPPQDLAAVEQAAVQAGYPTLSPDQINAVNATIVAARATATVVAQQVSQGERVNATEAPRQAPIIVYFFATVPTEAQAKDGIRYHLNYTTENANRVEIFGSVMENPQQGSWPVYNESDHWVLWAANDQVWVEQFMPVEPDKDAGSALQGVTVNSRNVMLTLRDPQLVDGDQLSVDVNGVRVVHSHVTEGRHVSFPITLHSGANTISVYVHSAGATVPLVAEVTISNVTAGPAVQLTRAMNNGESESFTITAP